MLNLEIHVAFGFLPAKVQTALGIKFPVVVDRGRVAQLQDRARFHTGCYVIREIHPVQVGARVVVVIQLKEALHSGNVGEHGVVAFQLPVAAQPAGQISAAGVDVHQLDAAGPGMVGIVLEHKAPDNLFLQLLKVLDDAHISVTKDKE